MRNHKIGLQGILFDAKSSFMQGSALAPPQIRKAYNSHSANYYSESGMELTPDIWSDMGDFKIKDYFEIEAITDNNLTKEHAMITLGGDHSITYPILKAVYNSYGRVNILHIDAHSDLYDEFEGDKFSHACPLSRIMEEKLANRLVQVGIRTLSTHQKEQAEKFDVEIIAMKDFNSESIPKFDAPIYISLDIDALDPAYAPGVSHHEPGGLSTRQVLQIIQNIAVPIIGADIVEYNPTRDINGVTAMVCAKFLKEIAARIIANST